VTTPAPDATLAALVSEDPRRARVLESFGLDYCCHGGRPLAVACDDAGVDVEAVVAAFDGLVDEPDPSDTAWTDLGLVELAAHIVRVHHEYLWEELPALEALAAKVLGAHGARHPELAEVQRLVTELRADLEPHLRKEELVLFPAVAQVVAGEHDFPFGSIANPVRMMQVEHERAGELLDALRTVTNQYEVPGDGCASYRSLYERLAALEADTHLHIHKENNVLFPATVARYETAA
jgi:regulator of cell morphogenesis and NO signaling